MEYTFRNSPGGEATTIKLSDYDLSLQKGGSEELIPYASIVSVRIFKVSAHSYKIYIYPDDHKPIVIRSMSHDKDGKDIDQSREYALLVRVLHHHLKDKSTAVFSCGGNSEVIWLWTAISIIVSFGVSVVAEYFDFEVLNLYAETCILSFFAIVVVLAINARNFPKTYEPSEIPLQFLP